MDYFLTLLTDYVFYDMMLIRRVVRLVVYESHVLTEKNLLERIDITKQRIASGITTKVKEIELCHKHWIRAKSLGDSKRKAYNDKQTLFLEALAVAITQMDEEALKDEYRKQQDSGYRRALGYEGSSDLCRLYGEGENNAL